MIKTSIPACSAIVLLSLTLHACGIQPIPASGSMPSSATPHVVPPAATGIAPIGACPGHDYTLDVFPKRLNGNGSTLVMESPSSMAGRLFNCYADCALTVVGYACTEGVTWIRVVNSDYPLRPTGWIRVDW